LKSVIQAFRVLQEVAEAQPVGVSELARKMDLPKSTAHRFLTALEEVGWVVRKPGIQGGQWVLSAAPAILAQRVAEDSNLRAAARPVMERLRDACGEAVHLAVPQSGEVVVIDQVESSQPVRIHWPVGQHSPVHASANGKAIVAFSGGQQRANLDPASFTVFTPTTVATADEFEAHLAKVRERGFAVVRGELREDICSLAAPIFDGRSNPVASLSAFMPSYRMPENEAGLGEMVRAAAAEISAAMKLGQK
jgi:IclR family acetate operon transcriptional repressor